MSKRTENKKNAVTEKPAMDERLRPIALGEREYARMDRWRKHVAALLGKLNARALKRCAWIEKAEGRKIEDVFVSWMAETHGLGRRVTYNGLIARECDEYAESESTRSRDYSERSKVDVKVHCWTMLPVGVDERDGAAFVRCFYRRGDVGLVPAEHRAMKAAITAARKAEKRQI